VFNLPPLAVCGCNDALQRALLQYETGQRHLKQWVSAVVEFSCLHQFVIPDVTMYCSFYITAYISVHLEPINAWVLVLNSGHNILSFIWFQIGRIILVHWNVNSSVTFLYWLHDTCLASTAHMPHKYWDCEL